MRIARLREGAMVDCSNPDCPLSFYATPSRLATIQKSGKGYCSASCAYGSRRGGLTECPECHQMRVKYPNKYCGSVCYHAKRLRDLKKEAIK